MGNPPVALRERAPAARDKASSTTTFLGAHPYAALFALALVVRCVVVAMSGVLEGFVLDDGTYHRMAVDMASGSINHWDDFTYSLYWRTAAFLAPLTALYKIISPTITIGQLYVALIGATVVVLATRLAREFLEWRGALTTGAVLALLPSQVFWSAQLMKDASVWLALVALGLLVAIANRSVGRQLLLCGLGILAVLCSLAFLREHTLVVAAWATMAASMAGITDQRLPRIAGALVLGVTIPWVVAASGPAGLGLVTNAGSLEELRFKMAQGANTAIVDTTPGGTESELNAIIQERQGIEERISELQSEEPSSTQIVELKERSSELGEKMESIQRAPKVETSPGADLEEEALEPNLAHLPKGLSVMLLEPFPVPFEGSASLRLARLESVIWYPLLLAAAIGLWAARTHLRVLLFPILAGGGILIMYALSEGNLGTAHRHRGEFVWVVVLLASLGMARLEQKRQRPGPASS